MTTQGRQQAYSAGNKTYGFGRSNPTSGPVDKLGYRERNLMQNAISRRLGAPPTPAPFQIGAGNANGITNSAAGTQQSGNLQDAQASTLAGSSAPQMTPSPTGTMQSAPAPQGGFGGAPNTPGAMADGNPQPQHSGFDQAGTAAGFNVAMGGAAPAPAFGPGGHPGAMTPTMAAPPQGGDGGLAAYNLRVGQAPNASDANHPYATQDGKLVAFDPNDQSLRNTDFDPYRDRSLYQNGVYHGPGTVGYDASAHPGVNGFGQITSHIPAGYSDPAGPPGMQSGGIPMLAPGRMADGNPQPGIGRPEAHNPNNPTAGLPGDAQYSQFLQNQQQSQTQHNAEYTQQQHDAQVGAEKQRRDINDNAPDAYKHLLDTFAARGMAHSGRYADDLGQAHNNVAGQLSGIDGDLAQKLNDLLVGNANFTDNGQRDSQQAMNEMIARLAGNAGSLGLDQNTQNPQAPDANAALQQLLGGQFGQSPAAAPQPAAKAPAAPKRSAPSAAQAKLTHATSLKHAAVARTNAAAAAKKRK
jgi:hypothetical protein